MTILSSAGLAHMQDMEVVINIPTYILTLKYY